MLRFSLLFFLLLGVYSSTVLSAQAYFRASFGPGIGVSRDAFGLPALTRDSNEVVVEQRTIFGSFGNGLRFSVSGGYWFSPYFGIDLSVYYFMGFRQEYGGYNSASGSYYERSGITNQLRLTPSLEVRAPGKRVRPFARFGLVLPMTGDLILQEYWVDAAADTRRDKTTEIYGKFSLGFESSFGVEYVVSERVSLFGQVTYSGLRIRAKSGRALRYLEVDANGDVTDRLEGAPALLTDIEFQDVLTSESNIIPGLSRLLPDFPEEVLIQISGTTDFDRPLNLPTQSVNSNSLFLEVGVQYSFQKKPE